MDRKHYPVRKTSLADQDADDITHTTTPAERVAMVWQLTCQAWMFKNGEFVEPRLPRHVVRVVRNGR